MRKDRLLKLADFLETVPPKAFDMASWASGEPTKPEGKTPGDCGFAGCAVGWAVHTKMFRGLKFAPGESDIVYQDLVGWNAVAEVFGISGGGMFSLDGEAEFLFHPDNYPNGNATPLQVAKRIRGFVETGKSG